jgi:hypothetical protein
MAAAAVAMSPVEAAQAAFDSASKGTAEANSKVEFYGGQRSALEQQVAQLQSKYNAACKAFAAGDGTDPGAVRDELNRAESRLHGMVQLHEEWDQKAQPLAAKLQKAGLQLAWQKQQDEIADLLKAELAAKEAGLEAVRRGDEAMRAHGAVVYQVGQARKRLQGIEQEMKTVQ